MAKAETKPGKEREKGKEERKEENKEPEPAKGLTMKKDEEFGEWFSQLITKAELIEYTDVSGCYVFRPNSYFIWEQVQQYMNKRFQPLGVKNCYFPLFIPERLLQKEQKHVEGFVPEVAWVTHSGKTPLKERLAVRPTSETIMYETYKKWIRSHRDLPLLLNQWNNVVRWEFKNPVPFIRSREFLWQEGHTAHKSRDNALSEVFTILDIYEDTYRECYAVAGIKGQKTEAEKFPGAEMTTTFEVFVPSGKSLQGCTSHLLGQNFAKAFDITFTDEKEQQQYIWQNSWGFSTRTIGAMIMMHSDDKGVVFTPRVAPTQVAIVPILFEKVRDEILKKAHELADELKQAGLRVVLDDRDHTPGSKFYEWELKGVPLRIELGPRDLEKQECVVVRRDTGKKESLKLKEVKKRLPLLMEQMHHDLFAKSQEVQKKESVHAKNFVDLKKGVEERKLIFADWCGHTECEQRITNETPAKILCLPFQDNDPAQGTTPATGDCAVCGKKGLVVALVARSY